MEPASPARLYATAVGALLILLGIVGFFYGSSFGSPGTLDHTLGALRTNGWLNLLWAALGALGLLLAEPGPPRLRPRGGNPAHRPRRLGPVLDPGSAILGFLPAAGANEALNLAASASSASSRRRRNPTSACGRRQGDP